MPGLSFTDLTPKSPAGGNFESIIERKTSQFEGNTILAENLHKYSISL